MPYAWRGPSGVGALGAATQSIGPAPSASGPAGTGAGAPSDSGNDPGPGPGPGAPGAGGPFSANDPAAAAGGASGFGFDAPSRADMTASAVGALSGMAGLGGPISGALGAAAGVAAGNSASKGAGQFGGGLVGGAFFGPLGSMVGAYVGGKFGSGEWGFEGHGQFDRDDPNSMGRVGSGLNADNTPNNAPSPAPGLGLGFQPGVTSAPLGPPDAPGPGLNPPGPGPALGPQPDVTIEPLDAPWQAGPQGGTDDGGGKGGKEGGFGPAAPGPDFSNMYAANEPTTATDASYGSGSGDGSGSGCVVCTTLHDHRLVEPIIYRAITAYGALVNDTTMRGYHWWGKPLARFLDRSPTARWLISPLARPVVRELAFRGGIGKSTWLGRRLLGLGEIACAAVATLLTPKQGSCENCKCRLN